MEMTLFWLAIIAIGVYFLFLKDLDTSSKKSSQEPNEQSGLEKCYSEIKKCSYKHIYDDTAIALNNIKGTIYLVNGNSFKEYKFSEIRKWRYNISSGGHRHGSGLGVVIDNHYKNKNNKQESGLFLEVKDIDLPQWQILFPYDENKMEIELKRWMEILTQYLNEDKALKDDISEDELINIISQWDFNYENAPAIVARLDVMNEEKRDRIKDIGRQKMASENKNKMDEWTRRSDAIPHEERGPYGILTLEQNMRITKEIAAMNIKEDLN
jgi:hypothetical protein